VLGAIKVHSDYKINLIKDMQNALGGIKPGDELVVIGVNDGCFIKKRGAKGEFDYRLKRANYH
ncbi:MAG: hypothetical protein HYU02_08280, partial [Thaumarchaeota archaeon]|nr:hypothetical protein [Nitrososphaerota archaeon]